MIVVFLYGKYTSAWLFHRLRLSYMVLDVAIVTILRPVGKPSYPTYAPAYLYFGWWQQPSHALPSRWRNTASILHFFSAFPALMQGRCALARRALAFLTVDLHKGDCKSCRCVQIVASPWLSSNVTRILRDLGEDVPLLIATDLNFKRHSDSPEKWFVDMNYLLHGLQGTACSEYQTSLWWASQSNDCKLKAGRRTKSWMWAFVWAVQIASALSKTGQFFVISLTFHSGSTPTNNNNKSAACRDFKVFIIGIFYAPKGIHTILQLKWEPLSLCQ